MKKKELLKRIEVLDDKIQKLYNRVSDIDNKGVSPLMFNEEKKELVVGKWYKGNYYDTKYLVFPTELHNETVIEGYGFCDDGSWSVFNNDAGVGKNTRLAFSNEVESALIAEAKIRGHKYDAYSWNHEQNTLYGNRGNDVGHDILFENGLWSEVIEQDKFAELKEAYKNGAVIEVKSKLDGEWYITDPLWLDDHEYRIKPEEKPNVGDVCKFWDKDDSFIIGIYKEHDGRYHRHTAEFGAFDNAKKITQQEAIDLLFNK